MVCDVTSGEKIVGKICISKEGLYYHFVCRLSPKIKDMCRLIVTSEYGSQDLGICVPYDDALGIDCKVAVKRLGCGSLTFLLAENTEWIFRPIYSTAPFLYLHELRFGTFQINSGQPGIVVKNRANSVQG